MVKRILFAVFCLVSSGLSFASSPQDFVPYIVERIVDGDKVIINFQLSERNMYALEPSFQVRADGSGIMSFSSGLGISVTIDNDYAGDFFDINAQGIESIVNDTFENEVLNFFAVRTIDGEQVDNGLIDDEVDIVQEEIDSQTTTYYALIRHAELMPSGYVYSIEFEFDVPIPSDTLMHVGFQLYKSYEANFPSKSSFAYSYSDVQTRIWGTAEDINRWFGYGGKARTGINLISRKLSNLDAFKEGFFNVVDPAGYLLTLAVEGHDIVNSLMYAAPLDTYDLGYNYAGDHWCWKDGAFYSAVNCYAVTGVNGVHPASYYPMSVATAVYNYSHVRNDGVVDISGTNGYTNPYLSTSDITGPQPDLTPDYDVFPNADLDDDEEISANADDQPAKDVFAGATIWHRLENETKNRHVVVSDLRDPESESADGEISCRVVGISDWAELPGSEDELEYDTDNMFTHNNQDEVITAVVPNHPGEVLECRAIVDADDEVIEESESNNHSRIERFNFIEPPTYNLSLYGLDSAGSTRQGDTWTFHFNAFNPEQYPTPGPVTINFYSDGASFKSVTISALGAGETRTGIAMSHSSSNVGTEMKRACIAQQSYPVNLSGTDHCTDPANGALTVNAIPQAPTGNITGHSCDVINGNVNDPNGTRNLYIHMYDQHGYIGQTRANSSGNFSYSIANRRNGIAYTYRVYVLDDNIGGHVSNPQIGTISKSTNQCLPNYQHVDPARRAHDPSVDRYFYTLNYGEWNGLGHPWNKEGVAWYCHNRAQSGTVPLYRGLRHGWNWGHFYTTNSGEIGAGWGNEGVMCHVYSSPKPGTSPVHRLYNPSKGTHFFTTSVGERNSAQNRGFNYEGVVFHVFTRDF